MKFTKLLREWFVHVHDRRLSYWENFLSNVKSRMLYSRRTRAVALDISKALDRVWYAYLLYKLKSSGISGQIFGLISSFVCNRRPWVVLDVKFLQEYRVNTGVPQGSIIGPTPFTTLSCHLSMLSLILLSMLMILLSTPNVLRNLICGNNLNWLLNLNLID